MATVKPRVYIETSVLSYLTARLSRDLLRAAHQQITNEWWANRERFELFVSEAVLEEARRGDPTRLHVVSPPRMDYRYSLRTRRPGRSHAISWRRR